MAWLGDFLHRYPDLALYLALGLGYLIGGYKIKGFSLGSVTGSLFAGLLVGQIGHVPVSSTAKSILFLLFLFGIGYSVGPQVFRTLRGDGYKWVILGVFTTTVGLLTAYVVARYLKLDPGFSAGLLSGSLTESPAIGTASEAINQLPLPEAERSRLISHIAVADAVCYLFGTIGVIMFCGTWGPLLPAARPPCRGPEAGGPARPHPRRSRDLLRLARIRLPCLSAVPGQPGDRQDRGRGRGLDPERPGVRPAHPPERKGPGG